MLQKRYATEQNTALLPIETLHELGGGERQLRAVIEFHDVDDFLVDAA